ncbi:fumarate hydratase [Pseudoramibacter sp.]|uniref:fumarate hydratase n=1 Tax=Pseudoramibacter sp. TaxID=2034862 RepID=UPI0025EDB8EF|nr:fumarate hydratase [Pseudoramibacter sp.]MCH4072892.1 fumarate hydratase [Pseudoramibacter sp.]MCH4106663.1 fumarate hydratase [Pseudoramibacter sp.]
MKIVQAKDITQKVAQLCVEINTKLADDIDSVLKKEEDNEPYSLAKNILSVINENRALALNAKRPICQDTGMVVAFVKYGQDVVIKDGSIEQAIQEGVRQAYCQGYMRKSVVEDPLLRDKNTQDNTPAVIHYQVVPGEVLQISIMAKGFGSENTSALKMMKPSDGIEGVKQFIFDTIRKGAPNACAPIIAGVGIGGDFEEAALLAKKALFIPLDQHQQKPHLYSLEKELMQSVNKSGIGPMGMGGKTTMLGIHILDYPTHIAGLPVAVNICCYVDRRGTVVF